MKKITVVGCGIMGGALVNAFMKGGHAVTIVDLNREAAAPFVQRGASYAPALEDALDCDFILINLPDHSIGAKVIAECSEGSLRGKLVLNTITSAPKDALDMQKLLAKAGARHLEGRILGYPSDIGERGYLVYSGDKAAFDSIRDALTCLSPEPKFIGENIVGASVTDVAVINVHYGFTLSMCEGAALYLKNNLPVETFVEHCQGVNRTVLASIEREFAADLANFSGDFAEAREASLAMETHGIVAYIEAFRASGVKTTFSDTICRMMQDAVDKGYGSKGIVATITEVL